MNWVVHELYSPPQPPYFSLTPPPPQPLEAADGFSLSNRVSPSILLIIIILAIIFFVSGLLHLFVRFLMRPPARDMDDLDGDVTALQGQLQQLFHLHDAGVDQTFIDTLPVFYYKAIIGIKNPFDCAVCLCEFDAADKLRLLPKCSHAFHMECIDTWLLSHSTCPLCRANLLLDFSPGGGGNGCSPLVLVLESGSDTSREIVADPVDACSGSARIELPRKSIEKPDGVPGSGEKIMAVKLGKFKNAAADGGAGEGSSSICSNVDSRRCFSMGSFEYVMDETTTLRVPIRPPSVKKNPTRTKPGTRLAVSECDPRSRRFEFHPNVIESIKSNGIGKGIEKKESFSVSKIWMRGKSEQSQETSRRAFSFRVPVTREAAPVGEEPIPKQSNDADEIGSCYSMDSQASNLRAPSFTRRTLLWLMGRQSINKVGHSFSSSLDHV